MKLTSEKIFHTGQKSCKVLYVWDWIAVGWRDGIKPVGIAARVPLTSVTWNHKQWWCPLAGWRLDDSEIEHCLKFSPRHLELVCRQALKVQPERWACSGNVVVYTMLGDKGRKFAAWRQEIRMIVLKTHSHHWRLAVVLMTRRGRQMKEGFTISVWCPLGCSCWCQVEDCACSENPCWVTESRH